jgi:hypothetical protein
MNRNKVDSVRRNAFPPLKSTQPGTQLFFFLPCTHAASGKDAKPAPAATEKMWIGDRSIIPLLQGTLIPLFHQEKKYFSVAVT